MLVLRPYRPADSDSLYSICLRTGASGDDATAFHNDPMAMGHIYAGPYAALLPEQVLVAEDSEGVAGYILGTFDTDGFAARLERDWWPALRVHYAALDQTSLTDADRACIMDMQEPHETRAQIVAAYPAHIHMNLLPRLRGQRVGTRLLTQWIDAARAAGVAGIHLGANAANSGGIAFWTHSGFAPIETIGQTAWFGMTLQRSSASSER